MISPDPDENTYHAVRQVRLKDNQHHRRLDVVLYVNGLPLAVVELKQAGNKHATIAKAHAQLGTYLHEFPMAARTVVASVISDGISAQYGTPFTPLNHYAPWNVDEQGRPVEINAENPQLEILTFGLFNQEHFLDIAAHYTAFDATDTGLVKRIAKPHQFFAVRKAVDSTLRAMESNGKAGVVWHTQGSGKSMEMKSSPSWPSWGSHPSTPRRANSKSKYRFGVRLESCEPGLVPAQHHGGRHGGSIGMTVRLNHTIVHATDKHVSAAFLTELLGLSPPPTYGPFVVVQVGDTSLDFADDHAPGGFQTQHYAFLVAEDDFDVIWERIKARGLTFWSDPGHRNPGQINRNDGGRGLYWEDPDGHNLEIITVPYGGWS